jgi:rhodanese-related sulfurtransferase
LQKRFRPNEAADGGRTLKATPVRGQLEFRHAAAFFPTGTCPRPEQLTIVSRVDRPETGRMQIIELTAVDQLIAGNPPAVVLDVRLEEDHRQVRLPGSRNACVFKMTFLEDVSALGLDRDQPIVIYGAAAESHESRMAADKLDRAGYRSV